MSCHIRLDHLHKENIFVYPGKVAVDVFLLYLLNRKHLHMLTICVISVGILSLMRYKICV